MVDKNRGWLIRPFRYEALTVVDSEKVPSEVVASTRYRGLQFSYILGIGESPPLVRWRCESPCGPTRRIGFLGCPGYYVEFPSFSQDPQK